MIYQVLHQLKTPKTLPGLVQSLGAAASTTQEVLRLLESRGYVAQAVEGSQACSGGCGGCSMKRLCPSSQPQGKPAISVWRLTPKGSQRAGLARA